MGSAMSLLLASQAEKTELRNAVAEIRTRVEALEAQWYHEYDDQSCEWPNNDQGDGNVQADDYWSDESYDADCEEYGNDLREDINETAVNDESWDDDEEVESADTPDTDDSASAPGVVYKPVTLIRPPSPNAHCRSEWYEVDYEDDLDSLRNRSRVDRRKFSRIQYHPALSRSSSKEDC
jgi:hypothetical protein